MTNLGLDIALTGVFIGFLLFLLGVCLEEVKAPFLVQKMNYVLIGLCVAAVPSGALVAIWI